MRKQSCILTGLFLATQALSHPMDRIAPSTIHFNPDWSITIDGAIVSDTELVLNLDPERLSHCRARDANGMDTWKMQAFVSIDGAYPVTFDLVGGQGTSYLFAERAEFMVPQGRELTVWFKGSDASGCVEWDSNYGRNYHFAITPLPDLPVLSFNADWTVQQTGDLQAGHPVRLHYDLARATTCRFEGYRGTASWDVRPHARVDGKELKLAALTYARSWNSRGQQDVIVMLPAGQDLSLWFENTAYEYYTGKSCRAFDSNYGRNFHFTIH